MPAIGEGYEQLIRFMMNVLMIEVRAEAFFSFCVKLFRDPETFPGRRAEADLAATLVERIRTDEAIHVAYLATAISELRSLTFRRSDGGTIAGKDVIDPAWATMIDWHGREERDLAAARARATLETQVLQARGGEAGRALLARFDALGDRVPAGSGSAEAAVDRELDQAIAEADRAQKRDGEDHHEDHVGDRSRALGFHESSS